MDEGRIIVYLRMSQSRNGFEDPGQVEWDEEKEVLLRNELERLDQLSSLKKINWEELRRKFAVPAVFLKQQVFWIYHNKLLEQQIKLESKQVQFKQDTGAKMPNLEEEMAKFDFNKLFKSEYHDSQISVLTRDATTAGAGSPSFVHHTTVSSPGSGFRSRSRSRSRSTGKHELSLSGESTNEDSTTMDEVAAHLYSSRILSARTPRIEDDKDEGDDDDDEYDDDDDNNSNNNNNNKDVISNILGRVAEEESEMSQVPDVPDVPEEIQMPSIATGLGTQDGKNAKENKRKSTSKSPFLDQIKFLASKYSNS